MINRRIISAAVALIGSAVGLILSAANTKEDLIDIRNQHGEEIRSRKEAGMNRLLAGIEEQKNTPGSVLLDVREKTDYDAGHLPGAVHAELQTISTLQLDPSTPIFICCYRGRRSAMAAEILREAGFQNVKDIGGLDWYKGELEREE